MPNGQFRRARILRWHATVPNKGCLLVITGVNLSKKGFTEPSLINFWTFVKSCYLSQLKFSSGIRCYVRSQIKRSQNV